MPQPKPAAKKKATKASVDPVAQEAQTGLTVMNAQVAALKLKLATSLRSCEDLKSQIGQMREKIDKQAGVHADVVSKRDKSMTDLNRQYTECVSVARENSQRIEQTISTQSERLRKLEEEKAAVLASGEKSLEALRSEWEALQAECVQKGKSFADMLQSILEKLSDRGNINRDKSAKAHLIESLRQQGMTART